MKIEKDIPCGPASPAGRSEELQSNQRANRYRQAESAPSTATDQVQLSGIADSTLKADRVNAAERTARLQALSKAYQSGRYDVAAPRLSRKIVDAWLAGGPGRKE